MKIPSDLPVRKAIVARLIVGIRGVINDILYDTICLFQGINHDNLFSVERFSKSPEINRIFNLVRHLIMDLSDGEIALSIRNPEDMPMPVSFTGPFSPSRNYIHGLMLDSSLFKIF